MITTPRLWKSLTQANTSDSGTAQFDGQIVALPDGGYVVVWSDDSGTYNPQGNAIVGQRYDSAGNKLGGEVKISQFTDGSQFSPAVTVLANGNIAVAFVDFLNALGVFDNDIYVRILDPALGLVRTDLIDTGPSRTVNPSLTALPGGGYAIAYTLQNSVNDSDIVARIVNPAGAVGAQFDVDNQTDNRDYSQLATVSNGGIFDGYFVVVYQDESFGSATNTDIAYKMFSPTGTLVHGTAVASGSQPQTQADVAVPTKGGTFVVVWTETTDTGPSGTDIRARFHGVGGGRGDDFLVNSTTTGDQNQANVVALPDGGFLVTWQDDFAGVVRGQRYDWTANKVGVEFIVKNGVSADDPEATVLSDDRIAYALGDTSSGDADVMTSIFDPRTLEQNFDGINQTDFAWQHNSGQAAVWLLNDTSLTSFAAVGPNVGPSWHLLDDGDFNADGRSDFLWQDNSGQAAVWLMNGTSLISGTAVGLNPGPSWHVIDSGDFNGDSKDDILWQDNIGQAAVWLMNGTSLISGAALAPNPGADWHVKASGDFNGDRVSDILWQNDSGQAAIWLMNGTSLLGGGAVGPNPGPSWHVIDSGDFDGNNLDDILWQNDNGQAAIWSMSGTSLLFGVAVGPNPGADWHVVGAGQFNNGDINSDLLWQHDSGQAAVWLLNAASLIGGGLVGGNPGADWDLIA